MKKKITALLPMKLESVRIPNKNFKNLKEKPLFSWMLDKLLDIKKISNIIINTDAIEKFHETPYISNKKIIFRERKKELCGNEVSMNKIIADDLNSIESDIFFMTHTTNPLLELTSIENAIQFYLDNLHKYDSVFSVNELKERFYDKNANPINHDPNNLIPTQNLTPWYRENSNFYIFTKNSFKETGSRIGFKPFLYTLNDLESVDIDNPSDWDLAEAILLKKDQ